MKTEEELKAILRKNTKGLNFKLDAWRGILKAMKEASEPEEIIQPGEEAAVKWLLLKGMELTRIKGRFEIFERIHHKLFEK